MVMALRKSGATYRQIAEQVERQVGKENLPTTWGERYAHKDVRRELNRIQAETGETAQETLMLELARLDAALMAIWRGVQSGDYQAIDRLLRIMDRRAKMLGLDAPAKSMAEISGPNGGPVQTKTDVTHDFDGNAAAAIFDILEAAGAFGTLADEAAADEVHSSHANAQADGVLGAAAS